MLHDMPCAFLSHNPSASSDEKERTVTSQRKNGEQDGRRGKEREGEDLLRGGGRHTEDLAKVSADKEKERQREKEIGCGQGEPNCAQKPTYVFYN